jgi:hypothetical protein
MDTKWLLHHVTISPSGEDVATSVTGVYDTYETALKKRGIFAKNTEASTSDVNKRIFIQEDRKEHGICYCIVEKVKVRLPEIWVVHYVCHLDSYKISNVEKAFTSLEKAEKYVLSKPTVFKVESTEDRIVYGTKLKDSSYIIQRRQIE